MQKQRILILLTVVLATVAITIGSVNTSKGDKVKGPGVYSTWQGLELDKCASAWLIKRFVDKEAQFRFFPKGSFIKEGIPFDTPDAELRRDARTPVFGKVMEKYRIRDAALDHMKKVVWDIEINKWEKKVTDEAEGLNAVIQGLILINKDDAECLEKCYIVFDAFHAYIKAKFGVKSS